jgi:hypothetical protein
MSQEESMKSRSLIAVFLLLLSPGTLSAGTVPGRWEKIAALKPGYIFMVDRKAESPLQASFLRLEPDSLVVQMPDQSVRNLPKDTITKIEGLNKFPDRKRNGILIGAGVGFGLGFFGAAATNAHATASGPIWYGEAVAFYAGAGLGLAALGAILGAVIDTAHQDREVLYQAR